MKQLLNQKTPSNRFGAFLSFTTITGLLLMAAGISNDLKAQRVDRSQRPATKDLDAVPFPHYEEFTLANGLKVYFVPDPRPNVTLRLLVPGGSAVDGEHPGAAGTVADLLTKGSAGLSAQEFASEIDFLGGSIGASADEDRITVSATGLNTRIEPIVRLYTGVITDPAFDSGELQKLQSISVEGLKAARQSPDFLAEQGVKRILYGDGPLGAMPSEESIMAIDSDQLRRYHESYFSPKNAILAVVGNMETPALKALLEKTLGTWSVTTVPEIPSREHSVDGGRIVLIDRPTSVQSAIRVVGPGPLPRDEERTRVKIVGDILGGGTGLGNRLTSNLRETHGWTYSPYAYFSSNRYAGYHLAAADVRNEVTDSALREILAEIEGMTSSPVPDEELGLNIRSAAGTYTMSLANPNITALRVMQIDYYGMEGDYYDRLVDRYYTTSPDDVLALSRKYFRPEDRAIVVVGKSSEILDDLKAFGEVEVWNTSLEPVRSLDAAALDVNAEDVWAQMLDAMGGMGDLRKVQSISSTGKAILSMGPQSIPGTLRIVQEHPKNEYLGIQISFQGQTMNVFEQRVTAESAVQYQQGQPVPIGDGARDSMIAATHIMPEAWIEELGGSLKLRGMNETKEGNRYEVELSIPGTSPQTYLIDAETWLPVRRQIEQTEIRYGDWEEIDGGIRQPRSMTILVGGQEIVVSEIEYDVNGEVDASLFQPRS